MRQLNLITSPHRTIKLHSAIKETKHDFSLGFSLIRKIKQYNLIYSFATRSREKDLKIYYMAKVNELLRLGDYGYKLIRDIYVPYCGPHSAPCLEPDTHSFKEKPYLKLVTSHRA